MKYQAANSSGVENVGLIDSVFRGSLGIAIMLSVLLIPTMSSVVLVILNLVAIYAGLTAFISWDPFYALMKDSRHSQPEQLSPAVSADPGNGKQTAVNDGLHKKAA